MISYLSSFASVCPVPVPLLSLLSFSLLSFRGWESEVGWGKGYPSSSEGHCRLTRDKGNVPNGSRGRIWSGVRSSSAGSSSRNRNGACSGWVGRGEGSGEGKRGRQGGREKKNAQVMRKEVNTKKKLGDFQNKNSKFPPVFVLIKGSIRFCFYLI